MSSNKNNALSTIIACIAVGVSAVFAVTALLVNGFKGDNNNVSSADSDQSVVSVDTSDTSSLPSDVSSSEVVSSNITSSSNISSIISSSQTTSVTIPNPDDDPFGVDKSQGELVCYLTFDDGPCKNTDTILQILAENDVKATFFVVGTMSTNKIKDIYDAGHAIGLHTNTHELNDVYKNKTAYFNDLKKVSDIVYNKIGIRSNLVRFPGGSTTAYKKLGADTFETVKDTLDEQGYNYFDWNIDSGDTHSKSPSDEYVLNEIRKNLKYKGELRSEVCILMHDIKSVSVRVLPQVIKELKDLGYTFKTLDSKSNNFAFK